MTVSLRVFEHTCPAASDRIPGTILKPVTKKTQKNTNRKHKTISMVFQGEQAFETPKKVKNQKGKEAFDPKVQIQKKRKKAKYVKVVGLPYWTAGPKTAADESRIRDSSEGKG